jgi:peptidoglycan hydrolase CwlO-like protein
MRLLSNLTPLERMRMSEDELTRLREQVEAWNSCLEQFGVEPERVLAHVKGLQSELDAARTEAEELAVAVQKWADGSGSAAALEAALAAFRAKHPPA